MPPAPAGGDAEGDRVEVLEVVRVEGDPVAVLDERGGVAAAHVGRRLDLRRPGRRCRVLSGRAAGGREELGLLELRLEDRLAEAGERRRPRRRRRPCRPRSMTVKMFASIAVAGDAGERELALAAGVPRTSSCACVSWPSLNSTRTLSQRDARCRCVPSSASVTDTPYGIVSPKSATLPFSGISIVTTGRVLPAMTVTVSTRESPDSSVTVSRRAVGARGRVGVRRVRRRSSRRRRRLEVPRVGERRAVGVTRAGGRERHVQRHGAAVRRDAWPARSAGARPAT